MIERAPTVTLVLLALATAAMPSGAQSLLVDLDRAPDLVLPIWPDGPPGAEAVTVTERLEDRNNPDGLPDHSAFDVTEPALTVFRGRNPDGSALLIAPGGGYGFIVVEHEGWETARWFSRKGATVYVMTYRLPHQGWAAGPDTPLQDIQRAIRLIRSRAAEDRIDPDRVMVLGFSAGGHLAGSLATRFDESTYPRVDAADALSTRPDAAALIYPVVTMQEPWVHMGSRQNLIGSEPSAQTISRYSLETAPPADTPPIVLVHAGDDTAVPAENSIRLYQALQAIGIPSALHLFEQGGHGFGMRGIDDKPLRLWPELVYDFGVAHRIFGGRDD